jgi:putative DNA primase/helicase
LSGREVEGALETTTPLRAQVGAMMTFEEILSHLPGPRKPNGKGGFLVPCPAHDDADPSLSISPGNGSGPLFKCFAGCDTESILAAKGWTWQDILPPRGTTHRKSSPVKASRTSAPITVSDLSSDKGIPEDFLRGLGIEERPGGVLIPYRLMDGSPAIRQRARTALSAGAGSVWLPGDGSPVPYGVDRLLDAREKGFLVLVEGESDCWTLWLYGFPALGIPGGTMIKTLQLEYLLDIEEIYVWREPDKAGGTFAEKIPARLREIGYTGGIFEAKLDGVKDPNELHKKNPEGFKAAFQAALDAARTAPAATASEAAPSATVEGLEDFRATDLWNARLFAHLHGDKVRYCDRLGGWHYYDGKRWTRATAGEVERLAKDIPRAMYAMAAAEPNETRRQEIAKHAARTEAAGKLAAILELAKTESEIAVSPEVFDAQPWLFNVANGTLDLITGELLPHRPEDMITNISPAEWRGLDAK